MKTKIAKFGFEIEGEFSDRLIRTLEELGQIKGDGSVKKCSSFTHPDCRNLTTAEFITHPILLTATGRKEAKNIFLVLNDARKRKEFHWNKSAGFHVHVSFSPKCPPEIFSPPFAIFFHQELERKFGTVIRVRGKNRFCKLIRYKNTLKEVSEDIIGSRHDRYKSINFYNAYSRHGTIEFRIFPSAFPTRMYLFLLFTLKTIQKFLKEEEIKMAWEIEVDDKDHPYIRKMEY